MVGILKSLGGDVVVPAPFASSFKFKDMVAELPSPALAIHYAGELDDPSLATKVPASKGSKTKLKAIVESATSRDLIKVKVASALTALAPSSVSYGSSGFDLAKWFSSADDVSATVEEVAALIQSGDLTLWVEKYPTEDLDYATAKAKGPFPGYRAMLLEF